MHPNIIQTLSRHGPFQNQEKETSNNQDDCIDETGKGAKLQSSTRSQSQLRVEKENERSYRWILVDKSRGFDFITASYTFSVREVTCDQS